VPPYQGSRFAQLFQKPGRYLVAALCLAWALSLAPTAEAHQYAGEFLQVAVGARALGLGGAYCSLTQEGWAPGLVKLPLNEDVHLPLSDSLSKGRVRESPVYQDDGSSLVNLRQALPSISSRGLPLAKFMALAVNLDAVTSIPLFALSAVTTP